MDDPNNQFTAGDLLATNGAVIPNNALMVQFDQPPVNIGLDAVQFVGETENIIEFLNIVAERGRDFWQENPSALVEFMEEFGIDILFSTEGTGAFPEQPLLFLDGDLLSARNGSIVTANSNFLPTLPAGLPQRGADFGLDAFTQDPIEQVEYLFSTEIVSLEQQLTFTDGDVLQQGGSVLFKNPDLIREFDPVTTDLGLDALDFVEIDKCLPQITEVGGVGLSEINNTTGYASHPYPDYPSASDRPFGRSVSIRGQVPSSECVDVNQYEYRVEYQDSGNSSQTWVPIMTPSGWQFDPSPSCNSLLPSQPYQSNKDGWIPLATYWLAKNCRSNQALNVWNTKRLNDGRYKLRLIVQEIGNPASAIMSSEVPIVIDNTLPLDVEMSLYNADGTKLLANQCEINGSESPTVITIKGQVRDKHFFNYKLWWEGGDVHSRKPISISPSRSYYDGGRADIDESGTLPASATDVPLATFKFTDAYKKAQKEGKDPIKCGYTIRLRGTDRTILGEFLPGYHNPVRDFVDQNWIEYSQSFCFTPLE